MVKDIRYIIKRILIGVGIALVLMALKGGIALKVYARDISMGVPTKLGFCSPTGCTIADQGQNASTYTAGNNTFYVSSYTQGTSGGVGFEWANANLCVGQDLTFTGFAYLTDTAYSHTTITNVKGYFNSWSSNTNCSFVVGQRDNNMTRINYVCTGAGGGGLALYFHYNTDSAGSSVMVNSIQDIICDASNNDIVNSIESMNNNIITNQNENTQQIIQSITAGSEAAIESQKVCSSPTIEIGRDNSFLYSNGDYSPSNNWYVSQYIKITEMTVVEPYSASTSSYSCFYNTNKQLISCVSTSSLLVGNVTLPNNTKYVRVSINKASGLPKIEFKSCKNGNQALQDSLTDDTGVSNSDIDDLFGDIDTSDTPISDLLTMPITLLNAYIDGFSHTCESYSFGYLYGEELVFPCIEIEEYIGSNLWEIIDLLCSIFMFYNICSLIISAFENLTSLKDDFNLLYAKHYNNEYQGRHGGGD